MKCSWHAEMVMLHHCCITVASFNTARYLPKPLLQCCSCGSWEDAAWPCFSRLKVASTLRKGKYMGHGGSQVCDANARRGTLPELKPKFTSLKPQPYRLILISMLNTRLSTLIRRHKAKGFGCGRLGMRKFSERSFCRERCMFGTTKQISCPNLASMPVFRLRLFDIAQYSFLARVN